MSIKAIEFWSLKKLAKYKIAIDAEYAKRTTTLELSEDEAAEKFMREEEDDEQAFFDDFCKRLEEER